MNKNKRFMELSTLFVAFETMMNSRGESLSVLSVYDNKRFADAVKDRCDVIYDELCNYMAKNFCDINVKKEDFEHIFYIGDFILEETKKYPIKLKSEDITESSFETIFEYKYKITRRPFDIIGDIIDEEES